MSAGCTTRSPTVDQVVDAYLELAIRPIVELGSMTSGLASGDQTVFWWRGNMTPPRSFTEWADLLTQFAAPRRHLTGTALADLPVHITECNSSYRPDNPIHDTALHAAYLAPVLAAGGDLVGSFSYWTFSDMLEGEGVPAALFHGGFGLLTHRQIKKPTYHLYAFMARLGDEVLARGDDHLVTRHLDGRVAVLAWAPVEAGNAWVAWAEMGRPRSPRARQLDALREATEPARTHRALPVGADRKEQP
ncbi:hypothetical protein [Micromonospora sp. NPDC005413]|uniref:GH39 family glycosyl hydrolase n=1 Tax=Micromonospora sp. NPDC005413 TaxID=3154563 RepID=UPI0033A8DBA5